MSKTKSHRTRKPPKPTPPDWTLRQYAIVVGCWVLGTACILLMISVGTNATTLGGLITPRTRMFMLAMMNIGAGISILGAGMLRLHYNSLARPRRLHWSAEREALDAAHGLVPGEVLLGLVVVASDAERLLLRGQTRLYLNLCLRVLFLIAAVTCFIGGLIFGLRLANWPLFLISAIVIVAALWSYTHRILISPTAADGKPGILFERRKWICFRHFRALPFTQIERVSVELEGQRHNSIHLWLYGTDGRRTQFATTHVTEKNYLQARRLRNAILTRSQSAALSNDVEDADPT